MKLYSPVNIQLSDKIRKRHILPTKYCLSLSACLAAVILAGCNGHSNDNDSRLVFRRRYDLSIKEPSGIAIYPGRDQLWIVGGPGAYVYKTDLKGKIVRKLEYSGEDVEGIGFDSSDSTLWIVEERTRTVIHLDTDGNILEQNSIALTGEEDSGLEGICVDDSGQLYVLNEKIPGLFIELDAELNIREITALNFADDFSDLAYAGDSNFWILSDQDKALFLWNKGIGVIEEYALNYKKAEGVAYDADNRRIYVVEETNQRLYIYDLK